MAKRTRTSSPSPPFPLPGLRMVLCQQASVQHQDPHTPSKARARRGSTPFTPDLYSPAASQDSDASARHRFPSPPVCAQEVHDMATAAQEHDGEQCPACKHTPPVPGARPMHTFAEGPWYRTEPTKTMHAKYVIGCKGHIVPIVSPDNELMAYMIVEGVHVSSFVCGTLILTRQQVWRTYVIDTFPLVASSHGGADPGIHAFEWLLSDQRACVPMSAIAGYRVPFTGQTVKHGSYTATASNILAGRVEGILSTMHPVTPQRGTLRRRARIVDLDANAAALVFSRMPPETSITRGMALFACRHGKRGPVHFDCYGNTLEDPQAHRWQSPDVVPMQASPCARNKTACQADEGTTSDSYVTLDSVQEERDRRAMHVADEEEAEGEEEVSAEEVPQGERGYIFTASLADLTQTTPTIPIRYKRELDTPRPTRPGSRKLTTRSEFLLRYDPTYKGTVKRLRPTHVTL